jgi:hypothetical protein
MTHQHFQLIADVISTRLNVQRAFDAACQAEGDNVAGEGTIAVMNTAYAFSRELEVTNANFDRDRFLLACGVYTAKPNS